MGLSPRSLNTTREKEVKSPMQTEFPATPTGIHRYEAKVKKDVQSVAFIMTQTPNMANLMRSRYDPMSDTSKLRLSFNSLIRPAGKASHST